MAGPTFPEGALCAFLYHTDGSVREGVEDQIPCRISAVMSSRAEQQASILSIVAGSMLDTAQSWSPGKIMDVKAADIIVLYDGTEIKRHGGRSRIPNWDFDKLPVLRDSSINLDVAWQRLLKKGGGNLVVKLHEIAEAVYGEAKFSPTIAWSTWLQVADGIHWNCVDHQIVIRTPEEVEEKKAIEAQMEAGTGGVDREESQNMTRIKLLMTKETKQRLSKVSLGRSSQIYSVMSDREINSLIAKSTILQIEPDEVMMIQGTLCDTLYTVVVGVLEAIVAYGENESSMSKTSMLLTSGMTFGEECLVDASARFTVKSDEICELGVVKAADCKVILSHNTDLKTALAKIAESKVTPLDLLMKKQSPLLILLGELDIKYMAKHLKVFRVRKDHVLFEQDDKGDSMFLVIEGFVTLYSTLPITKEGKSHKFRTAILEEGDLFEESCPVLSKSRSTSAILLGGSAVGEITKSDLSSILFKNPSLPKALASHLEGQSSVTYVAESLMKNAPSALFRLLPAEYRHKLALCSKLVEYYDGDVLISQSTISRAIFLVVDGELEVSMSRFGISRTIGTLTRGHSVGEFGTVIATKSTATVQAKGTTCVIEIPFDEVDIVAYGLPDTVDDVHEVKAIAGRRNLCLEMQPAFIDEVMETFRIETSRADPKVLGKSSSIPFFSLWPSGEKVEVVEISPSIYGAVPAVKGRYERSDIKLSHSPFKEVFRAYDSLWKIEVAWNQVFVNRMSSSLKMQFLEEISMQLRLTNNLPSRMQYDLVEDKRGDKKALLAWDMSQATETGQPEKEMYKISSSSATVEGVVGMPQADFETSTGIEAWRALRPFTTEPPEGWYYEAPVKFMSKEELEELEARKAHGRVLFAPTVLKCYNTWEDEVTGTMNYITEVARPGQARRAFTCLNLGNVEPGVLQASMAQAGMGADARRALSKSLSIVSDSEMDASEARRAASDGGKN